MARLTKNQRQYRDVVIAVLKEYGIDTWKVCWGKKHAYVEYVVNGKTLRAMFANSKSCPRAERNLQAQTRRNIEEAQNAPR